MPKTSVPRIAVILFFLITDVILFKILLQERRQLIRPISNFLSAIHESLPQTILGKLTSEAIPDEAPTQAEFDPQQIYTAFNQDRSVRKLTDLAYSEVLAQAAQKIVAEIITHDADFDAFDSNDVLLKYLKGKKVDNLSLYHDAVIGPLTTDQILKYWQTDEKHLEMVTSPEITQVGVATGSATFEGQLQGIVVTIYAKPPATSTTTPTSSSKTAQTQKPLVFPEISDNSILTALNSYRQSHNVHQLLEHANLCEYAQKRVGDLVANGGLDGHAGFKKDFEDPENLPEPIKNYPGGAIGENLAYQNCKNMTTGQGFVAETATALIEWCFDSSTKGHREAQMNPKFNNVCARHKNGYFVIIFGE